MGPAVQYKKSSWAFSAGLRQKRSMAEEKPKVRIVKTPTQETPDVPKFPQRFLFSCKALGFHNSAFWQNCLVSPGLSSPRHCSGLSPRGPPCQAGHLPTPHPGRAGKAPTDLLENSSLPLLYSDSHSLLNPNREMFSFFLWVRVLQSWRLL